MSGPYSGDGLASTNPPSAGSPSIFQGHAEEHSQWERFLGGTIRLASSSGREPFRMPNRMSACWLSFTLRMWYAMELKTL